MAAPCLENVQAILGLSQRRRESADDYLESHQEFADISLDCSQDPVMTLRHVLHSIVQSISSKSLRPRVGEAGTMARAVPYWPISASAGVRSDTTRRPYAQKSSRCTTCVENMCHKIQSKRKLDKRL